MFYVFLNAKRSDLRLFGPLTKLDGGGGNHICGGTTTGRLHDLNRTGAAAGTLDDLTGKRSKLGTFLMSTLWWVRRYRT